MPLIMFILALCLVILFQNKLENFFFPFIIIFSLIFLVFNFNKFVRDNFLSFYGQTSKMVSIIINKDLEKTPTLSI